MQIDYYWKSYGLPIPIKEYRFSPPRKWRFDFAWPDQKVAVEIEGGIWIRGRHSRGKGMLADMEKYNEASLKGWSIFRFTPEQFDKGIVFEFMKNVLS